MSRHETRVKNYAQKHNISEEEARQIIRKKLVEAGAKGGRNGKGTGFAVTKRYGKDHPAHPTNAGRKGGKASKKRSTKKQA